MAAKWFNFLDTNSSTYSFLKLGGQVVMRRATAASILPKSGEGIAPTVPPPLHRCWIFLSGWFNTVAIVIPPDKKLVNSTSVCIDAPADWYPTYTKIGFNPPWSDLSMIWTAKIVFLANATNEDLDFKNKNSQEKKFCNFLFFVNFSTDSNT